MQPANKKLPIFYILVIWTLILSILGLLQLGGFSFGFKTVPNGEDLNWLGFIKESPYVGQVAHRFWYVDSRNPLSPWFWILVSQLVIKYSWGLYVVRCLLDPILAIIMYLLLFRFSKQQSQLFAFSVALITLMWNFFITYSHLNWVFDCALAFALLSVFFYCRYVDNHRRDGSDLALALVCYFIAISTYTLISGSIIAISLISLLRDNGSSYALKQRLFATARDTSFFLVLFILFYLIWYTTSMWVDLVVKSDVFFHWNQLMKSIGLFLFNTDYISFIQKTTADWQFTLPVFILGFLFFIKFFFTIQQKNLIDKSLTLPLGWVLALLISLAMPILILESTNSLFVPGTRSTMIAQVWQPLLYVMFIFVGCNKLPLSDEQKRWVLISLLSLIAALTLTVAIDYNHNLKHWI